MDLTDIYRSFTQRKKNTHSSQVHMEHSPRQIICLSYLSQKNQLLCDRPQKSLTFKKIKSIPSTFSGHNGIKLEIINSKKIENS